MVNDPASLQTKIAELHALERDALISGEVNSARDLAMEKFDALSALIEITQVN